MMEQFYLNRALELFDHKCITTCCCTLYLFALLLPCNRQHGRVSQTKGARAVAHNSQA